MIIKKLKKFNKEIIIGSDKSILIRAILASIIAKGTTRIFAKDFGVDCFSAISAIKELGANVVFEQNDLLRINLKAQKKDIKIDVGNSGTTIRLLCGLCAGASINATLIGDESISKRPMLRVAKPLQDMGALISTNNGCTPICLKPSKLHSISYENQCNSAQVKSAIIFAALFADGQTIIKEKIKTRDHSEILLRAMGAKIETKYNKMYEVSINKSNLISLDKIFIPFDISSASFLLVLATIINGSKVIARKVCLNSTRSGILEVFDQVGVNYRIFNVYSDIEIIGDIEVEYTTNLKPFVIDESMFVRAIDEIPILCVLACFIEGTSVIKGIDELRYKECDRVEALYKELSTLGVNIVIDENSIKIDGGHKIKNGIVDSHNDHRIAMALIILAMAGNGATIKNCGCIDISYPQFLSNFDGGYYA